MVAKLMGIISSVRFWLVTLAWAGFYISLMQTAGAFDWVTFLETVGKWLATVAGIGTLDRFGQSIGGK